MERLLKYGLIHRDFGGKIRITIVSRSLFKSQYS